MAKKFVEDNICDAYIADLLLALCVSYSEALQQNCKIQQLHVILYSYLIFLVYLVLLLFHSVAASATYAAQKVMRQ